MIDLANGVPGITAPPPQSYEQFWPLYLSNHLHPLTRAAHFVGDSATLLAVAGFIFFSRKRIRWLLLLIASQALTVLSHQIWEKNDYWGVVSARPAAGWVWKANGQLLRLAYAGQLGADVQLVRQALGLEPSELTLHDAKRFRLAPGGNQ